MIDVLSKSVEEDNKVVNVEEERENEKGVFIFFFKQKTAYEMRISDWSSDVCSSDLGRSRRLRSGRCGSCNRWQHGPIILRPVLIVQRLRLGRWQDPFRELGVDVITRLFCPDRWHSGDHHNLLMGRQLHHLARGEQRARRFLSRDHEVPEPG